MSQARGTVQKAFPLYKQISARKRASQVAIILCIVFGFSGTIREKTPKYCPQVKMKTAESCPPSGRADMPCLPFDIIRQIINCDYKPNCTPAQRFTLPVDVKHFQKEMRS